MGVSEYMETDAGERRQRVRILHVLGIMERGGAETWLMHILRSIDRTRYHMDFLVHIPRPGAYDDEIRALGGKVIVVPHTSHPPMYAREFARVLREHGPYDVVHSHVHQYSGFVLRLAKQAGVPVRIAHSHLDDSESEARAGLSRRLYLRLMRHWIKRNATVGLAASEQAALDLFGPLWSDDPRFRILFCGVDLSPFGEAVCRDAVRAEFGIPADDFVVGHVGRFTDQKNHTFLLDVAAEILAREPETHFLLVGEGELRAAMQERVAAMGIADRVIFAGGRADVPRVMRGAMDAFVFPSKYEGLGLVLIEAQAAGLPCFFADVVPHEADTIPELVYRLQLAAPAWAWAEVILAARSIAPPMTQREALAIVEATPFNVHASWEGLERVYVGD